MKIAFLSDTHIGRNDHTNDFQYSQVDFVDLLESLKSKTDLIILTGDIFEMWQGPKYLDIDAEVKYIKKNYKFAIDTINSLIEEGNLIYVLGNHDNCMRKLLVKYVRTKLLLPIEGIKLFVTHGHIYDKANSTLSIIGKTIAWLVGMLERLGWKSADQTPTRLKRFFPGWFTGNKHYKNISLKIIEKHNPVVVVMGHTHQYEIVAIDGSMFVNTGNGCNYDGKIDITMLECKDDKYAVERIILNDIKDI